ncbi:MAG: catechol 1,2-dioxygenase [Pseudomonadota bacterium]
MAEIVFGVGASHTTLMNTQWDKVDHLQRAHDFRNALDEARGLVERLRPDTIIIVGSNHFRGYWLDMMPAFSIGVGELDAAGEHGTPKGLQKVDEAMALDICNEFIDREYDVAFSTRLSVDHGISHAIQWIVGEQTIPVVPIVINCFAPPLPSIKRCLDFGDTLRAIVESLPNAKRVGVIATGGLSHQLPFPDWRKPESDDDVFLVDSWKEGRGNWSEYEARRREIIVNSPPQLNENFDHDVLKLLSHGEMKNFSNYACEEEITQLAGNGANEIRAWIVMAAALKHHSAKTLCYSAMPEWLTGMAVAVIEPPSREAEAA